MKQRILDETNAAQWESPADTGPETSYSHSSRACSTADYVRSLHPFTFLRNGATGHRPAREIVESIARGT